MPSAAALIAAVPAAAGTVAPAPGGAADLGSGEAFAAALAGVRDSVVKDAPAKIQGEAAPRVSSARTVDRLDLAALGGVEGQDILVVAAVVPMPQSEGAIIQAGASDDELSSTVGSDATDIANAEAADVKASPPPVSQALLGPAAPPASLAVHPAAGTGDEAAAPAPNPSSTPSASPDAADQKTVRADALAPLTNAARDQAEGVVPDTVDAQTEVPATAAPRTAKPNGAAVEHLIPAKVEAIPAAAPPTSERTVATVDPAPTASKPEPSPAAREAAKTIASTDPLPTSPEAPAAPARPKAAASDARAVEPPPGVDAGAVQISAVVQKPAVAPAVMARPVAETDAGTVLTSPPAATAETKDATAQDAGGEPTATSQDAPPRPGATAITPTAWTRTESQPLRPVRHDAPASSTSGANDASQQAAPSPAAAAPEVKPETPTLADAPSSPVPPPVTTDPAAVDVDPIVDAAPAEATTDAARVDNATAQARDPLTSGLSRATIETTAHLAAQIARKLEGRSTRFDMVLTPEDLGRVDVTVEIDADGQLAARLAFDNPAAAADLRGRADELRRQLQDAGFQLSQDSLDFSQRDPSSGGGAFDRQQQRNALFAGGSRLAAQADLAATPSPGAWTNHSLTPERVDMRV